MKAVDTLETLELLGSSQWGLVTTAQCAAAGVQRMQLSRLVSQGTLHRIRQGVYALPSADHGQLQELRAAWLAVEPTRTAAERTAAADPVVVAGVSAANVHSLGNLIPTRHEFSSPARRQSRKDDITYRRRSFSSGQTTTVDGLPVTTVLQTLQDLSDSPIDNDHLAVIVRDAYGRPGVTTQSVVEALSGRARQQGITPNELLNTLYETAGAPAALTDAYTTMLPAAAHAAAAQFSTIASSMISSDQLKAVRDLSKTFEVILPRELLQGIAPTLDMIAKIGSNAAVTALNFEHIAPQYRELRSATADDIDSAVTEAEDRHP